MSEERGLPRELRELNAVRSAAHRILADESVDEHARSRVMRALVDTARDATLPDWALETIEEEVDLHLGRQPQPRLGSYVDAARALRRLGYGRCPTCMLVVLSETEIAHYEYLDAEWLVDEARHAEAVKA